MDFEKSTTKENLMRAFAGESQARNRYTFAEQICRSKQLFVVADLFKFTADQEKAHAWVFYSHIVKLSQSKLPNYGVAIAGEYPVDVLQTPQELLKAAAHNENEEFSNVYPAFAAKAREEGFAEAAQSFENIAKIEEHHGKRFETFERLLNGDSLFSSEKSENWICLNCGYIMEGTKAPEKCPVCSHPQGYFIRLEMTPWH